jgi:hypothetical protein
VSRLRRLLPWLAALAALLAVTLAGTPAWLTSLGDQVLIPASFWGACVFITFYSVLAPWWLNPFGRMIVQLDLAFALVTLEPALQAEFGVTFSTGTELRLLVAALLLAAFTILSRIWYLGALHEWKLSLPWRHARNAERRREAD